MGLQAVEVVVVEDFDGGVLDGSVHALGLAVGPGMVGLGQAMLDAVGGAGTVEDMRAEVTPAGALSVFWQVGEGHAVVGQQGVYGVRESGHDISEEGGA